MTKRLFAILLAVFMILSFVSCGGSDTLRVEISEPEPEIYDEPEIAAPEQLEQEEELESQEETDGAPDIPAWAENYVVGNDIVLIEMRVRSAPNFDAIVQGMHNDIVFALRHAQEHHEGREITIHILDDLIHSDGGVENNVTVMRAMFTSEDAQNADIGRLRASPQQVRDAASLFTVHQAYRQ